MGKRRLAREYCLQALYLADISKLSAGEILRALSDSASALDEDTRMFADSLFNGAVSGRAAADALLQEYATNWKLTRMSAVDRCILRMAAYEILHDTGTPFAAVIDEAIELGKKYSTENSGRFINGVLDRMKDRRPEAKANES